MAILIRHFLRVEPDQDLDVMLEQYAEALWIEDRIASAMTNSMAKAFNANK